MSESVSVKMSKLENLVEIKLVVTRGKASALFSALDYYETPVGNDLLEMLLKSDSNHIVPFTRSENA